MDHLPRITMMTFDSGLFTVDLFWNNTKHLTKQCGCQLFKNKVIM